MFKAVLISCALIVGLAANEPSYACFGYAGPGGPCSMGPGGGLSMGPGGGLSMGPGGGLSMGPNRWRRVPGY